MPRWFYTTRPKCHDTNLNNINILFLFINIINFNIININILFLFINIIILFFF